MTVLETSRVLPGAAAILCGLFALSCGSDESSDGASGGAVTSTGGVLGTGGSLTTGGTSSGGASSGGATSGGTSTGGSAPTGGSVSTTGGSSSGGTTGGTTSGGAGGDSAGAGAGGGGAGGGDAGGVAGGGAGGASGGGAGGGGGSGGADGGGGTGGSADFTLTAPWESGDDCSPDNTDACELIPAENTMVQMNDNVMPTLSWTPGPTGTQSYVLIYHDLTFTQGGSPFVHWAMWNIPSDVTMVSAGMIPDGVEQASLGQGGAWAGSGACGNVYELILYALSVDAFTPSQNNQTGVRNDLAADDDMVVLASDTVRGRTGAPNCME